MTETADPELLSLYLRLFCDEDVSANIMANLRQRGFDVVSARDTYRLHLDDDEQLSFAIAEKRTIFTHNRNDFEKLHDHYIENGNTHYGIIIAKRRPTESIVVRKLLDLIDSTSREQMMNQLRYI